MHTAKAARLVLFKGNKCDPAQKSPVNKGYYILAVIYGTSLKPLQLGEVPKLVVIKCSFRAVLCKGTLHNA